MIGRASRVMLFPLAVAACLLSAAPAFAQAGSEEPGSPPPSGPLLVPHAVEDTVMELVSQGQVLLIRETTPSDGTGPKDHPQAWQYFLDGLTCLLRAMGDRVLDDSRGPQYVTDHGLRLNIQRPRAHGFPVLLTFYNNMRPDETAVFVVDRDGQRFTTQRVLPEPPCCWACQSVRAWSEGGHEYAVLHLQGVGPVMSQYRLRWLRREPDGWQLHREGGTELFGERVTFGLNSPPLNAAAPAFPTMDVVSVEPSTLFENPPSDMVAMVRTVCEVHADTLLRKHVSLDPSSLGPSTWVMEALVRGHREWAEPYVLRTSMLDSLAALPWAKAREHWKIERASEHFDTLLVSHPAAGRFEMYTAQTDRRWVMTGYRAVPASAAKAATRPRSGRRKGQR